MLAARRAIVKSTGSKGMRFFSAAKLPDLPYDFGALEPVISAEIMQIHHSKHHNAYVTNLNLSMTKLEEATAKGDTQSLSFNRITAIISLQQAIKFNGGGHLNHSIFWQNLAPVGKGGGEMPAGELLNAIKSQYGSLEKLQEIMGAACVGVQGSGWGWLGFDKTTQRLAIATCGNQDPLQATTGLIPLLGIDVWEHAYYLQVTL